MSASPLASSAVFGYTPIFEPSGRACRVGSYALNDPDDRAHPKAPSVPLARKAQGHNRGHAKGKLMAQANNGAARER